MTQLPVLIKRRTGILMAVLILLTTALAYGRFQGWLGSRYAYIDADVQELVDVRMQAIERGDYGARQLAQTELVSIGARVTPCVLPYLESSHPETREIALTILGRTGDWSILPEVESCLSDQSSEVRHHAVRALYNLASVSSMPMVQERSHDNDYRTRAAVAMTLGDIPHEGNVGVLVDLARDDNSAVRHQAVVSLGRLGDVEAVPVLAECLADPWGRTQLAAMHSLNSVTGLPAHPDSHLWVLWYAAHNAADISG